MITKENFPQVLESLKFQKDGSLFTKRFDGLGCDLKVDFSSEKLIYPEDAGMVINDGTTSNFSHDENFVVFECVHNLLLKGYRPESIEIEPRWSLGHDEKGGKADICVKGRDGSHYLCIIECKTAGAEFRKELSNMLDDDKANGSQLFSYWQQERGTKWLCLYASDFSGEKISHSAKYVNCTDDANIETLAKNDKNTLLFKNAGNAKELWSAWSETYKKAFVEIDILFGDDTVAYDIGTRPLRKKDLVDFSRDDRIVNQFEEILRHNNVSDKENAFNRLITLFIAKLYDEKTKTESSEVDFQYKAGTDTYQNMQDRLQQLHHLGMKLFMKEDVFYIEEDFVSKTIRHYTGTNRDALESTLNDAITKLKFYTNNDFSFKDVHNEKLFYQNGKILVEMVQLFQKYRIIDSKDLQLLGDLFEQLLNKGFKQNEGQFFTPVPITNFIWKSLPLESILLKETDGHATVVYPKIIDYACGAGHFLTQGFAEVNAVAKRMGLSLQEGWERNYIYGIEKDYRLARVSKISLFMHGADEGNIIFGDGLENYDEKVMSGTFDILVANPPYSVSAFKNHLDVKNNHFRILDSISKDGSEIETLFVERIAQLLKPKGRAAVILPSSILTNGAASYVKAREEILQNFAIRSVVQFGSKTFGATGTNTAVLFLEKNDEPPVMAKITRDIVTSIFAEETRGWADEEIFQNYVKKIGVTEEDYAAFLHNLRSETDYAVYENHAYFGMYVKTFEESADCKTAKKQDVKSGKEKDGKPVRTSQIRAFYAFCAKIEKEKIYYFALVYGRHTLIVTAPSDNAEQEAFLGYGWSNRKGDEGIKIRSQNPDRSCGLLYNADDEENCIARYVKDSFLGICRTETASRHCDEASLKPVSKSLASYMHVCDTHDMLDFSRVNFDKAIKTNGKTENGKMKIESKYPLKSVENLLCEVSGNRTKIEQNEIRETGKFPVITQESEKLISGYTDNPDYITDLPLVVFGDHSCTFKYVDFPFVRGADGTQLLKTNPNELLAKYFYYVLNSISLENADRYERHFKYLKTAKIPLPPIDVQQKIVAECERIDSESQNAQNTVSECKKEIEQLFASADKTATIVLRLSDKALFEVSIGRRILNSEMRDSYDVPVYSANVFEPFGKINKLLITDFSVPSVIWGIDGDWQVNCIDENQPFYPTDHCGVLRVKDESKILPKYLAFCLEKEGKSEGFKRSYRASIDRIEGLSVTIPPLSEQHRVVSKITALESKISAAKAVIASSPARKQSVLEKWLNGDSLLRSE